MLNRLLLPLVGMALASAAVAGTRHGTAHRVVTLAPQLAQLVCAAGACDQLVAVARSTNEPPEAAKLPKIGNAWGLDYEGIAAARPDLVLAWGTFSHPAINRRLRQLGMEVRTLQVHKPADVGPAILQIGAWLGTRKQAERTAAAFDRQLAALRHRYAHASPVRVFFQIGTTPAYTVNDDSPISKALAICGGVNVFAKLPHIAGAVSPEAVLKAWPQAVFYTTDHTTRSQIKAYWARLPDVPAEANGHIFGIQTKRITASPKMLTGIRQVCTLLDRVRGTSTTAVGG